MNCPSLNSHRCTRHVQHRARWLAAVSAIAIAIASCGGTDSADTALLPAATSPAETTARETAAAADVTTATSATTPPAGSVKTAGSLITEPPDTTPDPDATRTVTHLLGEVEVPATPERIAVLGRRGTLPILLDLGFKPVGAIDASFLFGNPFHPLIMDRATAAGVEPIPFAADGPNLEAVALLQPDLIIGNLREFEAVAAQLQQIAPVIALQWDFANPISNVHKVADLMGVPDAADALVADFEADLAAASEASDTVGSVSIAGFFGASDLRVYRGSNTLGQLVVDLGGQLVPTEQQLPLGNDPGVNYISQENLEVFSGERLISFVNHGSELRGAYDDQIQSPLVQALPAFQNDQVLEVDPQLVFGSAGIEGLRVVVGQLVQFFTS